MQFGIFTIGDITRDPVNHTAPSENERIKNTVEIAKHAEEVGFDVFATGRTIILRLWRPATRRLFWHIWQRKPSASSFQPRSP